MTLLSAPIRNYDSPLTLLMLQNYGPLMRQQPYNTRYHLGLEIVKTMLEKDTVIDTPEDVHNILELCDVLIRDQDDAPTPTTEQQGYHGRLPPTYHAGHHYTSGSDEQTDEDIMLQEQGLIAKLIQLFQSDEDDTQFLVRFIS